MKHAQLRRVTQRCSDEVLESKEKFQEGTDFVHWFWISDKIAKNGGYIKPNLRERIHKDVRSMLREIGE